MIETGAALEKALFNLGVRRFLGTNKELAKLRKHLFAVFIGYGLSACIRLILPAIDCPLRDVKSVRNILIGCAANGE